MRILPLAAPLAALTLAVLPTAASATDVCNEAENSPRGGYTVTGDLVDPNPPAFLRGSQMSVGTGSSGLTNAAEQSPALRTCSPAGEPNGEPNGDPNGGSGGGEPGLG